MPNKSMIPEALFRAGFTDLVSVIPPGAKLVPSSTIAGNQVGKVPGRRTPSGLWAGYDWRKHAPTPEDVIRWTREDGANVGLRATRFPGVDIDCTDPGLAKLITKLALERLGPAPMRVGKPPKQLLMYRTDEPFSRMRLWIERGEQHHLVEILGLGQQYLVHGTHPGTMRPYEWSQDIRLLAPEHLTLLTREQAAAFLDTLQEQIDTLGLGITSREGDGRPITPSAVVQESLVAPSIELLREAVDLIPNVNELFPSRTDYLTMGIVIRAASGLDTEAGWEIFASWAARWEGNERAPNGNDPDTVRRDWRRFRAPYRVGWPYIAEKARPFGFEDAPLEFDVVAEEAHAEPGQGAAPIYSDQWLADRIAERRRGQLRFVPLQDKWLVWDGRRWVPDAVLLAEDIVKQELRTIASELARQGATDKEKQRNAARAEGICSAGKATAVRLLLQSERAIALEPEMLDQDIWKLNTPGGIVDLRTGQITPPDPDALCTRATAVAPDRKGAMPRWTAFLWEASGEDPDLIAYLQRFLGYCLTGSTREQQFAFIHGSGENGKGVLMNTVLGILHDYGRQANASTFNATTQERHTTELAMLMGARVVLASETEAGNRWDEQRIKSLTGGDPITARFMRMDNFTYRPQFKLLFAGNHKPEIRNVDHAMRRRIHLVPFNVKPRVKDPELVEKLKEEWPAILGWMVEGCLRWQAEGLAPPMRVVNASNEYLDEEDVVGRWLKERCERGPDMVASTAELFASWQEWANEQKEFVGNVRRLSSALVSHGFERWRCPQSRRMGFRGLKCKQDEDQLLNIVA